MPVINGFGILKEITPERMPCTIFVTAYDRFALDAFEAHALDYLLKPFSDQRFRSALDHVRRYLQSNGGSTGLAPKLAGLLESGMNEHSGYIRRVALKLGGRVIFLPVEQIDWVEASGVYIRFHAGSKAYMYRSSITQFTSRLDPNAFVRIHRSAIVNTDRIKELQPRGHGDYTVTLKDGTQLIMSRAYRASLENWLQTPL